MISINNHEDHRRVVLFGCTLYRKFLVEKQFIIDATVFFSYYICIANFNSKLIVIIVRFNEIDIKKEMRPR